MKKVLFATTALVAFAGAASAQSTSVGLSGSAEMGIVGGTGQDAQFFQSVDVRFSLRGTSDNGLSFGATVDLEDAAEQANNVDVTGFADYTVFISGDWGTLTMGDTDGALDWALTEAGNMGNPGSIADNETAHIGYLGAYADGAGDGQILRYDNTFGAVGVAVSVEQSIRGGTDETGYAIGVRYNVDLGGTTLALGAGFQNATVENSGLFNVGNSGGAPVPVGTEIDIWGVSAVATLAGGVTAGIVYSDWDLDPIGIDASHIGVGVGYETGPITLHANWGEYDLDGIGSVSGFGVAAAYDLGGGASVHVAYGDSDGGSLGQSTASNWSLGVAMSF